MVGWQEGHPGRIKPRSTTLQRFFSGAGGGGGPEVEPSDPSSPETADKR